MNEHLSVPATERTYDYYQSSEYFRILDTPLSDKDAEFRRRLYEPKRYTENSEREIPIEKQYSPLHDMIAQSSLGGNDEELQKLRTLSAEYAIRITSLPDDEYGSVARETILAELLADLPVFREHTIEGLQRYEYPGSPVALMLDGAPLEDIADIYKEITPRVIRPSEHEWRRAVVDVQSSQEPAIEQYDLTVPDSFESDVMDAALTFDDEMALLLEDKDDMIGYEALHNAKMATLEFSVRALTAVTGQFEKIERLLQKTAV